MYFKAFTAILIVWLSAISTGATADRPSRLVSIDKIAAVVNNEIITLTDIDKAVLLYPVFPSSEESEEFLFERVLQDLIHYKVVALEYREDFELTSEDFEEVQTPVIDKQGSLKELLKLLKRFDMEWPDFKDFIRDRVVYEKVVKENFQMKIPIPFKDIETFYHQQYLPAQEKLNLEPRSLIEMAPLIERHLRSQHTEERLSRWLEEIKSAYKIKNLLQKERK
jgi:parvulin-like peptidyl-prolyl isomerase